MGGVVCERERTSGVARAARYNSTAIQTAVGRIYGGVNGDYYGEKQPLPVVCPTQALCETKSRLMFPMSCGYIPIPLSRSHSKDHSPSPPLTALIPSAHLPPLTSAPP
ncbi:unnamed protein product [Pleuronectes platessa]|uniref:Uncharacterized protein n=1 Tax=Pleuronectes platessa TaxID=8262 RepID=A0A9N7TLM4_PLEPL|nr:unnamed protein product [Pleuronectes platessa]